MLISLNCDIYRIYDLIGIKYTYSWTNYLKMQQVLKLVINLDITNFGYLNSFNECLTNAKMLALGSNGKKQNYKILGHGCT